MPHTQLSEQERQVICALDWAGWTRAAIARQLGRHRATIGRELDRNRGPLRGTMSGYFAPDAHRKAQRRRAAAGARRGRIAGNALGDYVRDGLARYWSPQQIAGRIELEHPDDASMRISHEAIYRWVYRQAQDGAAWHRQLRRGRGRRKPRIPRRNKGVHRVGGVGIHQRPPVVNFRGRVGDWESDTVVGAARCRARLATHVERASRYTLIRKMTNGRAATFNRVSVRAFDRVPAEHRLTMTADNGGEFARFTRLEKRLGLRVYFAEPYKAWQRGANENLNGLLRQFFPRGMDLSRVSRRRVAEVEALLNNRPRKCLNYRTPAEVLGLPPSVALRV
jgi:IS30 family transposase